MNFKVSADSPELRMNYLPIMREQFQELLFCKDGPRVTEAIALMDEYGLDRDDGQRLRSTAVCCAHYVGRAC